MPDTIDYKATLIFQSQGRGWTESYNTQSTDLRYEDVMEKATDLAKIRAKLLGSGAKIKAVRVSRQDEVGEALLKYVDISGNGQEPCAQPDVCVQLKLQEANVKKRKYTFLRGIWDSVENDAGVYINGKPDWDKAMKAFKAVLANGKVPWGWWGVTGKAEKNLTEYTVDANNRVTFTFAGPLFPGDRVGKRDRVRLSGVNGKSRLNGVQVVDVLAVNSCISYLPMAHVPYAFGGKGTYNTYGFIRCERAEDEKIATREAGAPLLESAGRARTKPRV